MSDQVFSHRPRTWWVYLIPTARQDTRGWWIPSSLPKPTRPFKWPARTLWTQKAAPPRYRADAAMVR